MKKFLSYLLITVLFSAWGLALTNREEVRQMTRRAVKAFQKPCAKSIKYSIGEVDPQFGISRENFQEILFQSEGVWEGRLGKNLFQYDAASEFKINLVFDSRQARTIESENMEERLSDLETSYDSAEKQYNSLSAEYKKKVDTYERSVAEYKRKLEKYNDKVAYWNGRGGAPEDEYEDLKDNKKELDRIFSSLEKERREINSLVGKTNDLVQKRNNLAEDYNQSLSTYKNKFGGSVEFDKGVYDGNSISIFQFYEESDLRLTLAHEMGHALGLGHVENPKSLMYYLMGEQDMENIQLSVEDLAAIKQVCDIK